jgi:hypothetical protein
MSHSALNWRNKNRLLTESKYLELAWELAERKSATSTTTVLKFGNLNSDDPDAWIVQLYMNGSRYIGNQLNGSKSGKGTFIDIKGINFL